MPEPPVVRVSLVYAEPERVFSVTLELPDGATVADAIDRSGIQTARPDIDIRVGIFSRKATRASRLRDGDRVEIYRPLKIDPKEARRRRAGKT